MGISFDFLGGEKKVSGKELVRFLGFLVRLLGVGFSIQDAISKYKTNKKWVEEKVKKLSFYLSKGYSFSQALKYTRFCDEKVISVISAGEESANLYESLKALKENLEAEEKIKGEVKKSLIFPIIEVIFAFLIGNILLLKIVPTVLHSLMGCGFKLPELSRKIYDISLFYRKNIIFFLLGYGALLYFLIFKQGLLKRLLYNFPVIGEIYRLGFYFSFFFQIQLYMLSGASVSYAVQKVRSSFSFEKERKWVEKVLFFIKRGFGLDDAIERVSRGDKILEEILLLLSVVKQTGEYVEVLEDIVKELRGKYEKAVSKIGIIAQPLIMLFIAGIVLLMIFAVYYPVFTINPLQR